MCSHTHVLMRVCFDLDSVSLSDSLAYMIARLKVYSLDEISVSTRVRVRACLCVLAWRWANTYKTTLKNAATGQATTPSTDPTNVHHMSHVRIPCNHTFVVTIKPL